ncbi:HSP20-like chaperones superfamily protein [Tasmannia lanceolata]|uniref:HSP20-like chaperones superfamily protein n=1 Tax=Tasmannia lanceolata TaxID=3420 RepID=UPI004063B1D9
MSPVADSSSFFNGNLASAVNHLLHFPEEIEKLVLPSLSQENHATKGLTSIPVDILETSKEYVFYFDVPGLSKTYIQVTVEDDNILVIKSSGKRKRGDGEDEGCKYIRLERKASPKFLRKFKLPENCNSSAISAKCENGVLSVTVEKLPPPPKGKTVEVAVS